MIEIRRSKSLRTTTADIGISLIVGEDNYKIWPGASGAPRSPNAPTSSGRETSHTQSNCFDEISTVNS